MNIARHFAADYEDARAKFRAAAEAAGARLESFANPAANPDGVELTTDVAALGDPSAEKMLLTFSGTHGAEGFCGSGVQTAWLAEGFWREVPDDTRQVHVHAINPYGFAALSSCGLTGATLPPPPSSSSSARGRSAARPSAIMTILTPRHEPPLSGMAISE